MCSTVPQASRKKKLVISAAFCLLLGFCDWRIVVFKRNESVASETHIKAVLPPAQPQKNPGPEPSHVPLITPKHDLSYPVIITSIHIIGKPTAGQQLGVVLNMRNVSGRTLETTKFQGSFIFPNPKDFAVQVQMEEKIWNELMRGLQNGKPIIRQIPTAEGGLFNIKIYTPTLTEDQAKGISDASLLAYFVIAIRDNHSGKDLVELCGYAEPNDNFTQCSKHNGP
jgi:hypothetical protein